MQKSLMVGLNIYNSRNSKDLIVGLGDLGDAILSTTVEIQKT